MHKSGVFQTTQLSICALAIAVIYTAQPLNAATPVWSVVESKSPSIPTPGFPSNVSPLFSGVSLSDSGLGRVRGQLGLGNFGALSGHWLRVNQQLASTNTSGVPGTNRLGAEARICF